MKKTRLSEEAATVEAIIRLYCRKKEHNRELCANCNELLVYARARLTNCRFGGEKPTCERCPTHCYRPDMRQRIRIVMRYAGPRILFHHPIIALKHLIRNHFSKKRLHPNTKR